MVPLLLGDSLGVLANTTPPTSKVPLSAAGPSPLPGRLAAVWGTARFLSSPDPSGPHSLFLFGPSARRGRGNGRRRRRHSRPSCQLAAWRRYLSGRPRPARAGAGEAGFYFRLNIAARGRLAAAASPCSPRVVRPPCS